jgi:hypothetical protein
VETQSELQKAMDVFITAVLRYLEVEDHFLEGGGGHLCQTQSFDKFYPFRDLFRALL